VFSEKFRKMRSARITALGWALADCLLLIKGRSQTKYLRGGHPLNVRTGRLIQSLTSEWTRHGNTLVGSVGTDVFYGRVHEFGAQTPGHIVKPVSPGVKHLKFRLGPYGAHGKGTGPWVSVKSVRMMPKPWLKPAVDDMTPRALKILAKAGLEIV